MPSSSLAIHHAVAKRLPMTGLEYSLGLFSEVSQYSFYINSSDLIKELGSIDY